MSSIHISNQISRLVGLTTFTNFKVGSRVEWVRDYYSEAQIIACIKFLIWISRLVKKCCLQTMCTINFFGWSTTQKSWLRIFTQKFMMYFETAAAAKNRFFYFNSLQKKIAYLSIIMAIKLRINCKPNLSCNRSNFDKFVCISDVQCRDIVSLFNILSTNRVYCNVFFGSSAYKGGKHGALMSRRCTLSLEMKCSARFWYCFALRNILNADL